MMGQGILSLTIRRQLLAWRCTSHVPIHRITRCNGFSLVELMIVGGLTAVVIAGLGALTLISDVRLGRRSNSNSIQEAQEQWGRAVNFIQNEVADDAASLSVSPGDRCDGHDLDPRLVVNIAPARSIVYGVRERTENEVEAGLYRGPNLLVRCGPPPGETTPRSETVLLDRLSEDDPLRVRLLAAPTPDNLVYDSELTINIITGTNSTYAGDQPFRVHVQRTP
jgi:hypothetical protein